jgi:hypothetical protein
MKHAFRILAAVASTALLAACGSGDVYVAPSPYQISNQQAVVALTAAKSNNVIFVKQIVNLSNSADVLIPFTAANVLTTPAGASAQINANCAVSGYYSYIYRKMTSGAGLGVGDYYSVLYTDCLKSVGGVKLNGKVIALATSDTFVDLKTASIFALPVTLTFTSYSETTTTGAFLSKAYDGTVNFTSNSFGASGVGSEKIVATTLDLAVASATSSSTTSVNFKNGVLDYAVSSAGSTNTISIFDVYYGPSANNVTVAASTTGGTFSTPNNAAYTVTNVFGGKVIGITPSFVINVDDGNDGSTNASFTAPF